MNLTKAYLFKDKDKVPGLQCSLSLLIQVCHAKNNTNSLQRRVLMTKAGGSGAWHGGGRGATPSGGKAVWFAAMDPSPNAKMLSAPALSLKQSPLGLDLQALAWAERFCARPPSCSATSPLSSESSPVSALRSGLHGKLPLHEQAPSNPPFPPHPSSPAREPA